MIRYRPHLRFVKGKWRVYGPGSWKAQLWANERNRVR